MIGADKEVCMAAHNFDHPDAFDVEAMVDCLESLRVSMQADSVLARIAF